MKNNYRPLRELLLFRFRSFMREPEAVFWSYGFPLVLTIALGIAFRNQPPAQVYVDIEAGAPAVALQQTLAPGDADDLAGVIARLVSGRLDWDALRTSAIARHAEHFSDRSMAAGVAEVYRRVLSRKG